MGKQVGKLSSEQLSQVAVKGMQEMKAEDIVVLDLRKVKSAIADFFIIASGNSDTHVGAIADSVDIEVDKITGESPWHREGQGNKTWVLLDYVDIVVHVFSPDKRDFYDLETLWGDAVIIKYDQLSGLEAQV